MCDEIEDLEIIGNPLILPQELFIQWLYNNGMTTKDTPSTDVLSRAAILVFMAEQGIIGTVEIYEYLSEVGLQYPATLN